MGSTRYTYHHSQSVVEANAGYVADPISTISAQAVLGGNGDISSSIEQGLSTGGGNSLLKYWQYTKRRLKQRAVQWSFKHVRPSLPSSFVMDEETLKQFDNTLVDVKFRIIQEHSTYNINGAKFYADMNKLYGLNEFDKLDDRDNPVDISSLEDANIFINNLPPNTQSWIVGTDGTSSYTPVIILDPSVDISKISASKPFYVLSNTGYTINPSIGIIYWIANQLPTHSEKLNIKKVIYADEDFIKLKLNWNDTRTEAVVDKPLSNWNHTYTSITTEIDTNPIEDNNTQESFQSIPNTEIVTTKYLKKLRTFEKKTDKESESTTYHEVEEWVIESTYTYDEERYIWATETEESHTGIRDFYHLAQEAKSDFNYDSKSSSMFKLYPYLPTKENWSEIVNFKDSGKYLSALGTIQGYDTGDNPQEKFNEDSDVPIKSKVNREERQDRGNYPSNVKSAQRTVSRGTTHLRRMGINNVQGFKSTDERHLEKAASLLGQNYKFNASSTKSSSGGGDIYHSSIVPAVTLGSNSNDVNKYWFEYWKNMYQILGDGGFTRYRTALLGAKEQNNLNLNTIPIFRLDYRTGQLGGQISFLFIKKFILNKKHKYVRRQHRTYDVCRGKVINMLHRNVSEGIFKSKTTYTLSTSENVIQELLNPLKEFADDSYYLHEKTKKEYPIGGGKNTGLPLYGVKDETTNEVLLALGNYGYTFFCKPIGKDKVEVYAVCGLVGGTVSMHGYAQTTVGTLSGYTLLATAHHELGMFFERNKQRRVNKVASSKVNATTNFHWGSGKYQSKNYINSFFVIPLDYIILRRMGTVALTRFAQRGIILYSWTAQETKKRAGWVGAIIKVIGAIIAIVVTYFSVGTASQAGWTIYTAAVAIAKAVVINVVVGLAVKYGLKALMKVLGLKGLIAVIIVAIITIIAMAYTGYSPTTTSLPYASQTASAQVATEVATQATTQTVSSIANQFVSEVASQVTQNLTKEIAHQIVTQGFNTINESYAKEFTDLQKQNDILEQTFNESMNEIEEFKEEQTARMTTYDVREVLQSLRFKLYQPDAFFARTLGDANTLASIEYLSSFLESRLDITPELFDSVNSLDFSLAMRQQNFNVKLIEV